jgi:hypothetical protein
MSSPGDRLMEGESTLHEPALNPPDEAEQH